MKVLSFFAAIFMLTFSVFADENGVIALQEAIALGYRPQPNEK